MGVSGTRHHPSSLPASNPRHVILGYGGAGWMGRGAARRYPCIAACLGRSNMRCRKRVRFFFRYFFLRGFFFVGRRARFPAICNIWGPQPVIVLAICTILETSTYHCACYLHRLVTSTYHFACWTSGFHFACYLQTFGTSSYLFARYLQHLGPQRFG